MQPNNLKGQKNSSSTSSLHIQWLVISHLGDFLYQVWTSILVEKGKGKRKTIKFNQWKKKKKEH